MNINDDRGRNGQNSKRSYTGWLCIAAAIVVVSGLLLVLHDKKGANVTPSTVTCRYDFSRPSSLVWSPDGSRLVTAEENTVSLWDSRSGTLEKLLVSKYSSNINAVMWSSSEKSVAVRAEDGKVMLCDPVTGSLKTVEDGRGDEVHLSVWAPDGHALAQASSSGILVSPVKGEVQKINDISAVSLDWSPDSQILAAASESGVILVSAGSEKRKVFDRPARKTAWSPDGKTVAIAGESMCLYDAAGGKVRTFDKFCAIDFAWSPDGGSLAVLRGANGDDFSHNGTLSIITSSTGAVRDLIKAGSNFDAGGSLRWAPDGSVIAMGCQKGPGAQIISIIDPSSGKSLWSIVSEGEIVFRPDGKAFATRTGSVVKIWEMKTWNPLVVLGYPDDSWRVVLDISTPGSSSNTGSETNEENRSFITALEWTPSNDLLAVGMNSGRVKLVRPPSGKVLAELKGRRGPITSFSWRPDGKVLAGARADGTTCLWNTADNTQVILQGHSGRVNAVAFSPDGKKILTGSDDRTAGIWDAATGKILAHLEGHAAPVLSAAWHPGGSSVTTGDEKGIVKIWKGRSYEPGETQLAFNGRAESLSWDRKSGIMTISGMDTAVWDVGKGTFRRIFMGNDSMTGTGAAVGRAFITPDGVCVQNRSRMTNSYTFNINVLSLSDGKELFSFGIKPQNDVGSVMAYASAARMLAVAGIEGSGNSPRKGLPVMLFNLTARKQAAGFLVK
ncbi:MAG: WD40 repeat domain-containing protein [Candidatus Xenobiia bacterium LiM19]